MVNHGQTSRTIPRPRTGTPGDTALHHHLTRTLKLILTLIRGFCPGVTVRGKLSRYQYLYITYARLLAVQQWVFAGAQCTKYGIVEFNVPLDTL